jgi:hypothetical protein
MKLKYGTKRAHDVKAKDVFDSSYDSLSRGEPLADIEVGIVAESRCVETKILVCKQRGTRQMVAGDQSFEVSGKDHGAHCHDVKQCKCPNH